MPPAMGGFVLHNLYLSPIMGDMESHRTDVLTWDVLSYLVTKGALSVTELQVHFRIGYVRAKRIVSDLIKCKILAEPEVNYVPCAVLIDDLDEARKRLSHLLVDEKQKQMAIEDYKEKLKSLGVKKL